MLWIFLIIMTTGEGSVKMTFSLFEGGRYNSSVCKELFLKKTILSPNCENEWAKVLKFFLQLLSVYQTSPVLVKMSNHKVWEVH